MTNVIEIWTNPIVENRVENVDDDYYIDDEDDSEIVELDKYELMAMLNEVDDQLVAVENDVESIHETINEIYSKLDEIREFLNNS